jgi:hypothetical protein
MQSAAMQYGTEGATMGYTAFWQKTHISLATVKAAFFLPSTPSCTHNQSLAHICTLLLLLSETKLQICNKHAQR